MATTIDSLEIRIQSDSQKAAEGIEELAIALGDLKTNGKITTAVNNLNKLAEALRKLTPVTSSNAKKLHDLAGAVTALSKVGSINRVVNQLSRLPEALRGLSGLTIDSSIGGKLEGVANAVAPLSNIKAGGLNTMVNGLKKLDDVTDKLDDGTIARFAERIQKLSDKLTPLSQKMTTIQSGLRGVNSSAKSAGNGVKQLGTKVNATTLNLASMVTVIRGVVSALMPVVRLLSESISAAIEWDGIAARFGRGFGSRAGEVYSWVQRLNEEMGINVQTFMQYSSTYANMLTGFGVAMEDATEMALGYTELTYDIWAGYNDIYKSYGDAADAVRSAIAGEVEPIRRAGFTIVEATLEQTAANHGLEISLENATEAQKSYLRYLTLVNQAHSQNLVGTYARELNTAEGMMRTFSQQLKSLAQAFGSLFLPILVKVMPYLQAFVELLGEAIQAVAAFFGITIQGVDFSDYGSGLNGITDSAENATDSLEGTTDAVEDATEAIKDLKRATIGIDELNIISPPTDTSGSGGSGGSGGGGFSDLDIESLWDESIFNGIQDEVDAIKAKFEEWLPVIEVISVALGALSLAKLLSGLGDALAKMDTLSRALATVAIATIEAVLVFKFASDYLEDGDIKSLIGEAIVTALGSYLLYRAWGDRGLVLGIAVSIAAQLVAINGSLRDGSVSFEDPELWIQSAFTAALGGIAGGWLSYKGLIPLSTGKGVLMGMSAVASLTLISIRNGGVASGEITNNSFESWITKIGSVIAAAIGGKYIITALGGGKGGKMGMGIGVTLSLVLNLIATIEAKGDDFGNEISDWIDGLLAAVASFFTFKRIWTFIGPAVKKVLPQLGKAALKLIGKIPVWGWIAAAVIGLITLSFVDHDFTEDGKKIGKKIGEFFGWAFAKGFEITETIKKAIRTAWDGVVVWWQTYIEGKSIDEIVESLANWIGDILKKAFAAAVKSSVETWNNLKGNIWEFISGFGEGFDEGFDEGAEEAIDWDEYIDKSSIKNFLSDSWDVAAKWWNTERKPLKEYIPPIGSITGGLSSAWTGAKTWWNDTRGSLATYTPSIGSITTKLSEAWGGAKRWWNNTKGTLSTYTPSIGSITSKLSSAWSGAKTWWNRSKGKLSTYTPSIGSIRSNLSSAWSTAKTWWNRSKGSLSYTPSIGSIKNKLKTSWDSAKKWWKDNVKLSIPSLSLKVTYSAPSGTVNKAIVKALGLSGWPKLSFAANGGIFNAGSLIWAGERGPEIVANAAGGKTGVMNVDQMQSAVYEGVYAAMMTAMRASAGAGGQAAVNVYLDGRQITSAVEKRQHERGASIMGNQVYAY